MVTLLQAVGLNGLSLYISNLDILLTVHLSIIYFSLFPTWYTVFPSTYKYLLSSFLYMFQASEAHHQEV